ncbi:HD domain-containing phosphohydrolase [Vibrio marisflavi]|uniref:Cyclic di-GMP phosphodiesterase response regulator RpfG n=1 Tax=Vibrio marisflavi CECT 7928 TaxID=634439 RepID=A0ABM8ZYX9_9VIBR|nr:HD domain-containing phosphohydrolase [Vibrio marisflavi]CAH0536175.1 Cyclic di-GMP phosphodiesterase response regulator RpfG [Vibrio marisflavi CECT 7928]
MGQEFKVEEKQCPKLKVLLLDDEQDILNSLTRVLRYDYDVSSFTKGSEALQHLQKNHVPLIISDMRMPEMDGAEFLSRAKAIAPESIRFLLTGYSDIESTISAVNEGGIHTYIAKPWDNNALKETLSKAAEVFRLKHEKQLLMAELESKNEELSALNESLEEKVALRTKQLLMTNNKLQKLFKHRTKAFKDILLTLQAVIQHSTGQSSLHIERIAEISKAVAKRLKLSDSEIAYIYLAALVHQIGMVDQTRAPTTSSIDGIKIPDDNPKLGAEIIRQIAQFEPIVDIILHQNENYDGTGLPDHLAGDEIPIGSKILRVAKNYEFFISKNDNRFGMTPDSARSFIKDHTGKLYDPNIVKAFRYIVENEATELKADACIGLDRLKEGDVLKQDLYLPNGKIMVTAGQEISRQMLEKLRQIEKDNDQPMIVFI